MTELEYLRNIVGEQARVISELKRAAMIPPSDDATELVRLIQGKADPSDIALARQRLSTEQRAWLIERGGPDALTYWMGFGQEAWTRNPEHAVWFQRQVDAERVREGFKMEARVAEHLWR